MWIEDDKPKRSHCCDEPLAHYISLNKKQCNKCHKWFTWDLDEGQDPIFDGKHE